MADESTTRGFYQDRDGHWHRGVPPGFENERDDVPFPQGGYPVGGHDTSPIVELPLWAKRVQSPSMRGLTLAVK